jgi:hypothetical protein
MFRNRDGSGISLVWGMLAAGGLFVVCSTTADIAQTA